MNTPPTRAGPRRLPVARALLLAPVLLFGVAPPATAQRSGISGMFRTFLTGLGLATENDAAAPQRPPTRLEPCGLLYNRNAREIAWGPEYFRSTADWIRTSHATIRRSGLPLQVCFEHRQRILTSNLGNYLLEANNQFIDSLAAARSVDRRVWGGYVLTGHTDPVENDSALARLRAEWIQAHSPDPTCRYLVRWSPRPAAVATYRKVVYSLQPAARGCPRPPGTD